MFRLVNHFKLSAKNLFLAYLLLFITNNSFSQSSTANNLLRLRFYNNLDVTNFSEVSVRHGAAYSDGYESNDILFFPSGTVPSMYSVIPPSTALISINSTGPLVNDKTIKLGLYTYMNPAPLANTYTISANDLTAYTGTSMVFLIDSGSVPPVITNLKTTPNLTYNFSNSTYFPDRFYIKIYPQATATVDGCLDPNQLTINNPSSLPISYNVKPIGTNTIIASATNFTGTNVISSMPVGTYLVNYTNSFSISSTDTVVINGLPFDVSILTPDTTINVYNPYLSLAASSVSASPGTTFHWDFGDATFTSGTTTPFHLFPYFAGNYQVVLTATSNGCVARDTVMVSIQCPGFQTSINTSNSVVDIINPSVSFTSITNAAEPTATYLWNFGDGIGTSSSQNPTYTYPSIPGTYTAYFTVDNSNGLGCVVSDSLQITVTCSNTTTNINLNDTSITLGNLSLNFASTTTNATTSAIYTWNFNDGSSPVSGSSTTHTFPATLGNYLVTYTVNNGAGCIVSDSIHVNVICPNTVANITNSNTSLVVNNTSINVVATASNTLASTTYSWDFGDGVGTGTGLTASYTYPSNANNYTISFIVNNGQGCIANDSILVTVQCPNTNVQILTPDTILQLNNLNLNLQSTFSNAFANATYSWDFGDGVGTSPDTITSYTFLPNTGSYLVKFTVNNGFGCIVSDSIVVIIGCPNSTLNIVNNDTIINLTNLNLNLVSLSTNSNPSGLYTWNINNVPNAAQGSTINYTFPNTLGTYPVKVTLNNGSGCPLVSDSITVTITCPNTTVQILNIDTIINANNPTLTFNIIASDTVNNVSINWDFGNGFGTGTQPTYTFPAIAGNYPVFVTVDNGSGCQVLDSITVVVDLYTALNNLNSENADIIVSNRLLIINNLNEKDVVSFVHIYDMFGKTIKTINVSNENNVKSIPLNDIANGVYIVKYDTKSRSLIKKVTLN